MAVNFLSPSSPDFVQMASYCEICGGEFEESIDHHRRKHQGSAQITLDNGRTIRLSPDAENMEFPWGCVICESRYKAPGAVKKHMDHHHHLNHEIPDDGANLPQQAQ